MKIALLAACLAAAPLITQAQFSNTVNFSSTSSLNNGRAVVVDSLNNVYVAGGFHGTIDFDQGSGTTTRTASGGTYIFLAKYNSTGQLQWVDAMGGTGDAEAIALAIDSNGNIAVGGLFSGTVDFDPSTATSSHSANGAHDLFFGSYKMSNGALNWVNTFGSSNTDDCINSLTVDSLGNFYVGGYIGTGTTDVDPGTGVHNVTNNSSYGAGNIFFGKYSATGAYVWANGFGNCCDWVYSVKLDGLGNLVVAGLFQGGPVDFDPGSGTTNLYAYYYGDIWFGKYNVATGALNWVEKLDGYNQSDAPFALATDASGNVIIAGEQGGPGNEDFDPGSGTANLYGNAIYNLFVAKYSSSGAYQWAVNAGPTNTYNAVNGLALASNGDIHAVGYFENTTDFNPGSGTNNLTATGSTDAFDWVLSSSGAYVGATRYGVSTNATCANAAAMKGNVCVITGYYNHTGTTSSFFVSNLGTVALPINLTAFNATARDEVVALQWTMGNQDGLSNFQLERSADGNQFSSIATIAEHEGSQYGYVDAAPLAGKSYYRLRLNSENGEVHYGPITTVDRDSRPNFPIVANPVLDGNVRLNCTESMAYVLTSPDGKMIAQGNFSPGPQQLHLPQSGVYLLQLLRPDGARYTERIVAF